MFGDAQEHHVSYRWGAVLTRDRMYARHGSVHGAHLPPAGVSRGYPLPAGKSLIGPLAIPPRNRPRSSSTRLRWSGGDLTCAGNQPAPMAHWPPSPLRVVGIDCIWRISINNRMVYIYVSGGYIYGVAGTPHPLDSPSPLALVSTPLAQPQLG